jgi:hypothetical protein
MDTLVVGLLGSLGFVLGLAFAFFVIYRHHLRRLRRANRQQDPLSQVTPARRRPLPFHMPPRWLAIRSTNTLLIRTLLPHASTSTPWSESLARCRERSWFVSPPVDGWTLVVGARLPEPGQDVDSLFHVLTRLSRELGEVHFYSADRVLNFHSWARLDDGRVTRAYAWAGETLWNEGRTTLEERLLGLRCRAYGEEPEPLRYGDVPPEMHNTERVILLARRWSIDPVAASEILLHQEAVESGNEGDARE